MVQRKKFSKLTHINLIKGDSSEKLPEILKSLKEPALFWLDGHYSDEITAKGDLNTPIYNELTAILNHPIKNHVILMTMPDVLPAKMTTQQLKN